MYERLFSCSKWLLCHHHCAVVRCPDTAKPSFIFKFVVKLHGQISVSQPRFQRVASAANGQLYYKQIDGQWPNRIHRYSPYKQLCITTECYRRQLTYTRFQCNLIHSKRYQACKIRSCKEGVEVHRIHHFHGSQLPTISYWFQSQNRLITAALQHSFCLEERFDYKRWSWRGRETFT